MGRSGRRKNQEVISTVTLCRILISDWDRLKFELLFIDLK